MALTKLLDKASSPAQGAFASNVYPVPDYNTRHLFIGGRFGEALVTVLASPDGEQWFLVERNISSPTVIPMQYAPGTLLRVAVTGDQSAAVDAWI